MLNRLRPSPGSRKKKKRVGRGPGSGHGGTSTKGHKGQNARSGGGTRLGFEGGQMPMVRRIPKRGFTNIFRKEYQIVNLDMLESRFQGKQDINIQDLKDKGLIKKADEPVKILAKGELRNAFKIRVNSFSDKAKEKIEKAGGSWEIIK